MRLPAGVHYLAVAMATGSDLPPVFRVSVSDSELDGVVFSVRKDDWVFSAEAVKMALDVSDNDWVVIAPELAQEIVDKKRAWYRAQRRSR